MCKADWSVVLLMLRRQTTPFAYFSVNRNWSDGADSNQKT